MINILEHIKKGLLLAIIFFIPLFFLTFSQEYYSTSKLYLLVFGVIILLLISTVQFLFSKKITWEKSVFDIPLIIFLLTTVIAVIIASPNKIQALLNPSFGPLLIFVLTVFYFYLSRDKIAKRLTPYCLLGSSLLLSLIAIVLFFQPFKNIALPASLQFLNTLGFSPIGTQIDLAIFLVFSIIFSLFKVFKDNKIHEKEKLINFIILNFNFFGLCFTVYSLLKPSGNYLSVMSPYDISWYAAVEILKNPLTAIFGVGIDNFSAIFTRVKDSQYNLTNLWQISSFVQSRSAILHIFTESGLFGLLGFGLVILTLIKKFLPLNKNLSKPLMFNALFLLLILLFFPPSLIVFFIFTLLLAQIASPQEEETIELGKIIPAFFLIILFSLGFIAVASYFIGRTYAAEVYYKKSLTAAGKNDVKGLYNNQKKAILLNPYIEKFRINFSQTNLIIANNIAAKIGEKSTEEEKQVFSQAIQAAIAESKAAVSLNSQKALNWENLATVYRNILNVVQGADDWAISSYQRTILADPQNPVYRLNLGGIYYQRGEFDEAIKLFEQAITLKQNWPNAYYNLAWATFKKEDYQRAVNAMEYVLKLVDPQKSPADYEKAQKELEEFKKMLPKSEEETTDLKKEEGKPELTLPSKAPTIEPKIQLPKESSPEAK